jgi:glycine/D-amino acid oxidase-like deaminating enzyme
MGPWSILAAQWLPLAPVYGSKGHSIIFQTGNTIPAEALFLELRDESGSLLSAELIPRADGTTWICAISSNSPLPIDPAQVAPDPGAMDRLHAVCRRISPTFAESPVLHRQACFRPVTADGLPLVGAIVGVSNAYVATAHSVWGILNAPATAEALANLILDGASGGLDLSPFDPARLRPHDLPPAGRSRSGL